MKLVLLGLVAGAQVRAQARLGAPAAPGPGEFLIISSPKRSMVEYMRLPDGPVHPLVDHGLSKPQGVAVRGQTLYVADPGNQRIEAYELRMVGNHLTVGKYRTIVRGVEAFSIAAGDKLYMTDSSNKFVEAYDYETETKTVLFDGEDVMEVAAPGGIAMDGMQGLLWTNKALGQTSGSIVSADLITKAVSKQTQNVEATFGVCVSSSNIFYTSDAVLFGAKRAGGGPVSISAEMKKPRGCVYDTDGTVYVADEGTGKVYSLPANAETLASSDLTEVATMAEPYGMAYLYFDPDKYVKPGLVQRFSHWWATEVA